LEEKCPLAPRKKKGNSKIDAGRGGEKRAGSSHRGKSEPLLERVMFTYQKPGKKTGG